MTFRQLKLLFKLLAASLILVAPAKTRSCAYHDKAAKHSWPLDFARNGAPFKSGIWTEFVVLHERYQAIHFNGEDIKTTASIVVLIKLKKFVMF